VLSHAPRRVQAAMMLVDAFQPVGVTRLAVDSIFMMPHLGVLATVNREAAMQVFWRDCLVPLGTCIAPRGQARWGEPCMDVEVALRTGSQRLNLALGDIVRIELPAGESARVTVQPTARFDCGAGRGRRLTASVEGGEAGLIIDARGRPIVWPTTEERQRVVRRWLDAIGAYPGQPVGA
ncbi:MAG: glutamate mutase L, partial [Armatimonadetes bacterium]|nr:glutamate mutase L [Armatimonadota bacterium]